MVYEIDFDGLRSKVKFSAAIIIWIGIDFDFLDMGAELGEEESAVESCKPIY